MNSGVAFHAPHWNAGFGVTHLNAPVLRQATIVGAGTITYNVARHYYLFADYEFPIGAGPWSVRPRMIARTDRVKYSAQLSIIGSYSKAWLSLNYRTSDAVGFSGGYDFFGKYRVGYGYEWTTNQLSTISKGTHEITLGFLLK
jgi:type IX secretion system PorP/SprF family membrane protein